LQFVGNADGTLVGISVGEAVGSVVGSAVGICVVGVLVGACVGINDDGAADPHVPPPNAAHVAGHSSRKDDEQVKDEVPVRSSMNRSHSLLSRTPLQVGRVGDMVGTKVGITDGNAEGLVVGLADGVADGDTVGTNEGL
jgi:hypothetical protein